MLGALRLSLMEQTRVLEGKPIPVDLRAEPLRPIVEAGARFQSGRLTGGRLVTLAGEDQEVRADRLKLVTVFMNLIGNALKYSDGEVSVVWRRRGRRRAGGGAGPGRGRAGRLRGAGPAAVRPVRAAGGPRATSRGRAWGWCPPARSWRRTAARSSSRAMRTARPPRRPSPPPPGRYPSLLDRAS